MLVTGKFYWSIIRVFLFSLFNKQTDKSLNSNSVWTLSPRVLCTKHDWYRHTNRSSAEIYSVEQEQLLAAEKPVHCR